jgi:hypothetical protein
LRPSAASDHESPPLKPRVGRNKTKIGSALRKPQAWISEFDSIKHSLVNMGAKRLIHNAHLKWLSGRPIDDDTGIVHRWMQENYADSMLMGLRRILDGRRGSFSLVRLLGNLERNAALFSFQGYVKLWTSQQGDIDQQFVKALYARFSTDHRTLDRRRIREDVKDLLAKGETVLRYANTVVAHNSASDNDPTVAAVAITWADLDKLFDEVAELFNKYYGLARPGVHVDFAPVLPAGFDRAFKRMLEAAG